MTFIRSERYAAGFLLIAGVLGLVMANLSFGPALIEAADTHLNTGLFGLDLSAKHWISDGLLAVFFFLIAIELKRELVIGDLNSFGKAALPALAALGGVVVPAGIYLLITRGSGLAAGWPVPTATDIAFALGVLAVFGRGIPTRVRVFLLALAVLDDLVAILIIAFFFTQDPQLQYIGFAAMAATLFGLTSRLLKPRAAWVLGRKPTWPIVLILTVLGVATWYFTYLSGVHATIAGVILGLVMARVPGGRTRHVLEPYSNAVILPLFAFSAALVAIPQVGLAELSPAFWGILVALPVGKLIGITLAGALGSLISRRPSGSKAGLKLADIVMVACLGGIGFTVSLLMGALAFAGNIEVVDEATLAVLLGSGVAILASAVVVSVRARQYRRAAETLHPAASPSTR
ncbi:Na+/H+ antiporter NhaA [Cryobacterium adonitolivorans]|uniref:Na(+)/H(+) antiporter NhaA n=1 Tax=Cryobacterium adonitolivorans TaxID=1259189 RepID=A0A4R8WEL0_9MICO|nr:Na+/H+ antiporter NhaA [Cryobacterium adonitolivorans]TFC05930.1 Na+/H+ antiporter NhaA [Cryobacterium adonitolivorans]